MSVLVELQSDIAAFRNYLRAERGLADNTVQAYGRDLTKFAAWTALVQFDGYLKPTLRDLARYVGHLNDLGLAAPSVARHLAALRTFYKFLKLEERADPAAVRLLGSPKLWQKLPNVLTPKAVVGLLAAPKPGDRFFLRDRALLEVLYATGCRASEVVGLKIQDLYLDSGFLKCFGKGSKQRV
ncbi:MAG: site-specific integrase, partial [Fimbriiglobus sp.]